MKYTILIFAAFILCTRTAFADIHITEVAWMGTASSQYSEWLELYNDGDVVINLAGWKFLEGDGSVLFTLTKTIAANGYLLIERTTASAPDAVSGITDESGPFGSSGLANTGEDLSLVDMSGTVIESLDFASGWPAGDATTKHTMQWSGTKWITAVATPKTGVSGESDTANTANSDEEVLIEEKDPYPIPAVSPNQPHIEFTVPSNVYVGVPYMYTARPVFEYHYGIEIGEYYWNMGDGTMRRQTVVAPISHIYEYPGTYTLSFKYTDPLHRDHFLTGSKKVVATVPAITTTIINKNALQIKNTSSAPIDLSGWKIALPDSIVFIPDLTIVAERATVTLPFSILSITPGSFVSLMDPSGKIIPSTDLVKSTPVALSNDPVYIPQDDAPYESPILTNLSVSTDRDARPTPIRNRTKSIIFGAVTLFVIGLSILLERFMARQEYLSQ